MAGILVILLLILFAIFLTTIPIKKDKQANNLPVDVEGLYKENSMLRAKIKNLSYHSELLDKSNAILTSLPPVFSWDELRNNLRKINFEQILIDKLFLYSLRDNTLVFSLGIDSEKYHELLRILALIDKTYSITLIESNYIFIHDQMVDQRLKELLSVPYYCIYPLRTSQETIGYLLAGSQRLYNSQLVSEITKLLGQHLLHILNIIHIYQDIVQTQQNLENTIKNRTSQLKEAVEEISKINKAKSEFVSTVAHELRTSLTSIRGFASLIYDGKLGQIPDKVRDRIGRIQSHVKRLVDMVNTLLDINKIETGKIEMSPEPILVHALISSVMDSFMVQVQQKHIKLSLNCPHDIIIFADKLYFERVIFNLISNAVKFTPEEGEIRINVEPVDENTVQISVEDTGIGIHPKDLPHIFKEFYYIDRPEVTNIKGIGLGLSLVKRVVEANGGKIVVESESNKGTKFRILIKGKKGGTKDVSDISM